MGEYNNPGVDVKADIQFIRDSLPESYRVDDGRVKELKGELGSPTEIALLVSEIRSLTGEPQEAKHRSLVALLFNRGFVVSIDKDISI